MKKFVFIIAAITLLTSCGRGDRGQLVGARGQEWHPVKPLGMVLVPGGAFVMGKSSYDIAGLQNAPTKTVTVRSFYMDETEITNSEYRQFVNWVRDSVIRQKLAEAAQYAGTGGGDAGGNDKGASIQDYAFKGGNSDGKDGEDNLTPYQKYSVDYDPMNQSLNWETPIKWKTSEYPDQYYVRVMDEMYLAADQSPTGERKLDVSKLVYKYTSMNVTAVINGSGNTDDYVVTHEVPIYPDTTVWVKDFNYSYNEPMHNNYFWHAAYDNYPVVGVSWKQAKAFCDWRTLYHNSYRHEKSLEGVPDYRLPTEAEWEYAARGGIESGTYPWGGPYTKNARGCFLANFKPMRGNYAADQALYTVEAESYQANGYGLYNMAGNVSEWVNSAYDKSSYQFYSSMNPSVNVRENHRKVVRGGSWKDVAYYLQVGSRDYEYADSARSYIGFRTVEDYVGTAQEVNMQRPRQ